MNIQYRVQRTIFYRVCLVCVCVCFCVCLTTTKYANIVLEQRMREIFVLMTEGVAVGWTELYSEGLHGLCWRVNGGGW